MKKSILIFFVFVSLSGYAQLPRDMFSNIELFRINLKEKINLPGRQLPKLLIQAYCEGQIKAYYPFNVKKDCSYHEFLSHFVCGKPQPTPSADEFTNITCPRNFCLAGDDDQIGKFQEFMDIFQVKRFDKNLSREVYDVKYVRMRYVIEKKNTILEYQGPVFYYEDIINLTREDYKILNPKNTAANLTFKQYFESRQFNGVVVNDELNNSNRPKANEDNKGKTMEKDNWDH